MRFRALIYVAAGSFLLAPLVPTGAGEPPSLVAKRREAARVSTEIAAIDQKLGRVVESWDAASYRLRTLEARERSDRSALRRAQAASREANGRVARLLVFLYTSDRPSAIDAILGSQSLSQMLEVSDAEHRISTADDLVAEAAREARARVAARLLAVRQLERGVRATVTALAAQRDVIQRELDRRRALAARIAGQITRLQAEERLRQERLAAEARARLAAEARARRAAELRQLALERRQQAAEQRRRAEAARAERLRQAAASRRASVNAAARDQPTTSVATTTQTVSTEAVTTAGTSPTASVASPADAGTPSESTTTTTDVPTAAAGATGAADSTSSASGDTGAGVAPPIVTVQTAPSAVTTTAGPTLPLPPGHPEAASIVLDYLGIPYQWGGATPAGFDCSGLTSYVFAQLGVTLPHSAAAQYAMGAPVPRDQLQPGDLVFFDGLDHVGISIGAGEFVDAPHTGDVVKIESLDDPWYASHYVGARRV